MSPDATERGRPLNVLVVCTANQCRSPVIEVMLQAESDASGRRWVVSSAGTHASDGGMMHPHAATVLAEHGLEAAHWSTRRLSRRMVRESDLIITAETVHRRAVLTIAPGAIGRTFTLLELAGLLELNRSAGRHQTHTGSDVIETAKSARSLPHRRDQQLLDLADPISRTIDEFRTMGDRISLAVAAIARRPS